MSTPLRRRDRHGRGLRGPLLPPRLPGAHSRSQVFDDFLVEISDALSLRWGAEVAGIEFLVDDVPGPEILARAPRPLPLAQLYPARGATPTRIVVFRRPIEESSVSQADMAALINDVVVEQVAKVLGMAPEQVDPHYGR